LKKLSNSDRRLEWAKVAATAAHALATTLSIILDLLK